MLSTTSLSWRVPYLDMSVPQPGHYEQQHWRSHTYHAPRTAPAQLRQEFSGVPPSSIALTGIARLDRFIAVSTNGFQPASITLLDAQTDFLFLLVAQIIAKSIQRFDRDVLFIDGGNSFDVYALTACCRRFKLDPEYVLKRVKVARAFTVYQLDTLLTRELESSVLELRPAVVIGACISNLFLDKDVNWSESKVLLQNDFQELRRVTAKYELITVLTKYGGSKSLHRFELNSILRSNLESHNIIGLKAYSKRQLRFVTGTGELMDYYPLPMYQLSLDDFCDGGDIYR